MNAPASIASGLTALLLFASAGSAAAVLVVDFSPDTTGVGIANSSITDSLGQGQIFGDQFTLATGVTLTGGAVFGPSSNGGVSTPVQFMIFSNPTAAPILSLATTIDVVDSSGTTTQSSTVRKHATIPGTFLPAGSYWFSLASSDSSNFSISTGNYSDNTARIGSTTLANPVTLGDVFFQLEAAVPEPGTVSLACIGGLLLLHRRRSHRSRAAADSRA